MEKNAKTLNALVKAENKGGFIALFLDIEGCNNVSIKVNDFGGSQKKRAKALTYKIYKAIRGE